jgi:hypothetical protein
MPTTNTTSTRLSCLCAGTWYAGAGNGGILAGRGIGVFVGVGDGLGFGGTTGAGGTGFGATFDGGGGGGGGVDGGGAGVVGAGLGVGFNGNCRGGPLLGFGKIRSGAATAAATTRESGFCDAGAFPATATTRADPGPAAFAEACGRTSSGQVATTAARPMPSTPNSASP